MLYLEATVAPLAVMKKADRIHIQVRLRLVTHQNSVVSRRPPLPWVMFLTHIPSQP